jgi:hypothetical protein
MDFSFLFVHFCTFVVPYTARYKRGTSFLAQGENMAVTDSYWQFETVRVRREYDHKNTASANMPVLR